MSSKKNSKNPKKTTADEMEARVSHLAVVTFLRNGAFTTDILRLVAHEEYKKVLEKLIWSDGPLLAKQLSEYTELTAPAVWYAIGNLNKCLEYASRDSHILGRHAIVLHIPRGSRGGRKFGYYFTCVDANGRCLTTEEIRQRLVTLLEERPGTDDEEVSESRAQRDLKQGAEQSGIGLRTTLTRSGSELPEQVKLQMAPCDVGDGEASGCFCPSHILERLSVPTTGAAARASLFGLFDASSRETLCEAINNRSVPICACLSVAPRGSQEAGAQVFYHLGHFYFVVLFELIRSLHPRTALLLCPSRTYVKGSTPEFNQRMIETACTWMRCFRYVPEMHSIYRIIESEGDNDRFHALCGWLDATARKCRDQLNEEERKSVREWRRGPVVSEESDLVSELRKMFGPELASCGATGDQVISIAYVLAEKPGWYDTTWFAKSVQAFAYEGTSVQQRVLGTDDIVIVEAIKNRTAWEPLAVCAKAFYQSEFPRRAYFKNVPNVYGNGPMRSKEEAGVIPITDAVGDVLQRCDLQCLKEILRAFPVNITTEDNLNSQDAIRHALSEIMSEAREALYLGCASKKGWYSWERKSS